MILCVTLNPCLDKTLSVTAWNPGDAVRGRCVREVVGGKGNNVARALKRLGRTAKPATFLGGAVGHRCEELLRLDDAMDPLIAPTTSPTREILTVRTEETDEQTAFFDPDPVITPEEATGLIQAVEASLDTREIQALAMSGSSPSPATHGIYSELIALANARGIPTFLDTYGPALEMMWGFWPVGIQMNLREASLHLKKPKARPSDSELIALLDRWSRRGVRIAAITDGPNRFLARIANTTYRVAPPAIEPVNPIGSGDCFLAGLIDASLDGSGSVEMLQHAVGCAVANASVWNAGGIDRKSVRQFANEVVVDEIE